LAVRARALGKPIFLAGGLTPDNVAEAVETVQPFAVDVASGVEKSPKRKDFDRMKKFIDEAKNA
jgi:phosphoribosylanthranilate isomerase